MKVAICAIAKYEKNYILEWVEHYKNLMFDYIFIYNNDELNDDSLYEILNEHIKNNFVEIIDIRNQFAKQCHRYTECYNKNSDKFDYMLFVDIDEFLVLDSLYNNDIHNFLNDKKFKNVDCIRIPWMIIDDNNIIEVKDDNYSITRFKTEGKMTTACKAICKTKLNINSITPHGPLYLKNTVDPNGNICNNGNDTSINPLCLGKHTIKTNTYLRHYRYKTLEEYIFCKIKREKNNSNVREKQLTIDDFFEWNKKTPEKINYLKNIGINYE